MARGKVEKSEADDVSLAISVQFKTEYRLSSLIQIKSNQPFM